MVRTKPIREGRRRRARPAELGAAEGAFWFVLVLALVLGGGDAVRGLPALAGIFLPGGITAAHADVQGPSGQVNLPLHLTHSHSAFAPQVLTPVAARGFPDWLVTRAQFAGLASAGAAAVPARAPAIAIVIDDLGPDVAATRRAIALPKTITLSFLPYGDDTPKLARAGGRAGHQVIVHVPMEPEGTDDPGPMALRTDLSAGENLRRLDWALSRVPGHVGLNNHMGSRFTADRLALIPVMAHLQGRGQFFLDSRTTPHSRVVSLARTFGVASAARDVFLDDVQTRAAVDAQLAQTERAAREAGVAIAIGHPHDVTLRALKAWTARIAATGYRLVPVSTAIRLKTERDAMQQVAANPAAP